MPLPSVSLRLSGVSGSVTLSVALCLALLESPRAIAQDALAAAPAESVETPMPASLIETLEWRSIGPFRGGRAASVAGIPDDRETYYFGACGGGVWKTKDAGLSWDNVSDGYFGGSIGAVAVAESDPNVIYVGTGEVTVRGNVSSGDGVYKSTDAGRTWKHTGLRESRHVGRIRIHPKNPDLVYVAAMGHLSGPNEERGVYRSADGGKTWDKILFANAHAGAVDLILDPTNPRILYASTWRILRTPYSLESGGEGSALWKSTDSGDTWTELSRNKGLPKTGALGIIGVTVCPSNPDRVYAIVEHEDGGVFRSEDAGDTWSKVNSDRSLRQRAWYYTRIHADPIDADVVYVLNVSFHKSKDGGKTFSETIRVPHSDNHDLWIDPADPFRMIQANDGGANVSEDGGASWTGQDMQPTAQFYRVTTDDHFPYRIYGAQQDNSTVRIASRTSGGSIGERDWEPTAGGESGHIAPDPLDDDIVYGGSYGGDLTRVNHRTGERRSVDVWPDNPMGWGAEELRYRFQWNFPLFFSSHDPKVLYTAANVLFRSTNEGQSWTAISPDLTRDDKTKQASSGGPITQDNTSVEYYCTIFAACESPRRKGVLWCGSDDGLLHVSRDGGSAWSNVTPPELPEWSMINCVEPHPTEAGGLYLAATRYKLDDFTPYLFATLDYGASWRRIDAGIDREHFTRAVRADPERQGLLYAGTERGVYVSFDDGVRWQSLQLKLPIVPITDLAVKDGDLVAATQGRSFWVLDDLFHLRQLTPGDADDDGHLFAPEPVYRMGGGRSRRGDRSGQNPRSGAVIRFQLRGEVVDAGAGKVDDRSSERASEKSSEKGTGKAAEKAAPEEDTPAAKERAVSLEISDASGAVVRRWTTKKKEDGASGRSAWDEEDSLTVESGINTFEWDLRHKGAKEVDGMILWGGTLRGPRVIPGSYVVHLEVDGEVREQLLEVRKDPRTEATMDDIREQVSFLLTVRDKLTETHLAIERLREVRSAVGEVVRKAEGQHELKELGQAIEKKTKEIEEALYQTQNRSDQDPLNFPIRLNDKLSAAAGGADSGDYRPTDAQRAVYEKLSTAVDIELGRAARLETEDLPKFNEKARELGVPHVATMRPEDPDA